MVKTWDKTYASVGGRLVSRPADAFPRSCRRPRPSDCAPKWRSLWGRARAGRQAVRAGNAFDCGVAPVGVRDATVVWGSGRVKANVLVFGLAVVGVVQAA